MKTLTVEKLFYTKSKLTLFENDKIETLIQQTLLPDTTSQVHYSQKTSTSLSTSFQETDHCPHTSAVLHKKVQFNTGQWREKTFLVKVEQAQAQALKSVDQALQIVRITMCQALCKSVPYMI